MNKAFKYIKENKRNMLAAYSQNVLVVSEADRWDYALPENYTSYHGGFLAANETPYRGQPLVNLNGKILYLFHASSHGNCPQAKKKSSFYLTVTATSTRLSFNLTPLPLQTGIVVTLIS